MKRKSMASTLAIALAASTVSLISSPAAAAGQNPYDTFDATTGAPADAMVGVGSDTTQTVVHAMTDAWNLTHTPKLASFAADGAPADVKLRTSSAGTITRASINGSGSGKKLLYAPLNNTEVNFARSSSSLTPTETSAGLQQAAFAVDGLKMAVSTTTNAPASLTPQQVLDIYKGIITNWNQIGGTAGVIKPYYPQSGSGTYAFFDSKLEQLNGGTDVPYSASVGVTQEHSPAEIQNDPNAIAPFSTARASGISTIALLGGTEWKRAVYNVVRGADTSDANIAAAFGQNGFFCSAEGRAVIEEIGFVPLATAAQGGQCGVWTQAAVTDFTSFDDAGATTTTLAGSAAGSTVTLTATIGGLTKDGTVTFTENDAQVGPPVEVAAGKAILSLTGVTPGDHTYRANFAPADPQLAGPSTSSLVTVNVKKASVVTLSLAPVLTGIKSYYARQITATANVKVEGVDATSGSVKFTRDGATITTVAVTNGTVTALLPPTTTVGLRKIRATYTPTAVDTDGAFSEVSWTVLRAPSTTSSRLIATKIKSTTYPKVYSRVKIVGGVSTVYPIGNVKIYKGTKLLKTKALSSGRNTITLPKLAVGKHKLRAKYVGSSQVSPSYSVYLYLTVVR